MWQISTSLNKNCYFLLIIIFNKAVKSVETFFLIILVFIETNSCFCKEQFYYAEIYCHAKFYVANNCFNQEMCKRKQIKGKSRKCVKRAWAFPVAELLR